MTTFGRERGITLVTALIMLVLLTLVALTTFNVGRTNLQVVSNMQQHDEAVAAAREVIEETISNTRFVETPANFVSSPCGGPNQRCVDTNADGTADVKVSMTPPPNCLKAPLVQNVALNMAVADDANCATQPQQNFGSAGAVTGDSSCADSAWEITAEAQDMNTNAKVTVTQGVDMRIDRDNVINSCPAPAAPN
jgi:Tfp pilus assembly protein PilX